MWTVADLLQHILLMIMKSSIENKNFLNVKLTEIFILPNFNRKYVSHNCNYNTIHNQDINGKI